MTAELDSKVLDARAILTLTPNNKLIIDLAALPAPAVRREDVEAAIVCTCGHPHTSGADGEDIGCAVCACEKFRGAGADDRAQLLALFEYERFVVTHPAYFNGENEGASVELGEARRKLFAALPAPRPREEGTE